MQKKSEEGKLFALFILFFVISDAAFQAFAASPYDYYTELSRIIDLGTYRVLVKVGNLGAPGSYSGHNYDIILTVKRSNGQLICESGYSTLPPMNTGQHLTPLAFEVFWPIPPGPKDPPPGSMPQAKRRADTSKLPPKLEDARIPGDPYIVEANLRTQYPNDDVNPGNNYRMRKFNFPSGGQISCRKLLKQ
jgi:hypothetical protein